MFRKIIRGHFSFIKGCKIPFLQQGTRCDRGDGANIGDDKGILQSDTPAYHSDHLSDLNIFSRPQMNAQTLSFNSQHCAIGTSIARGFNLDMNNYHRSG